MSRPLAITGWGPVRLPFERRIDRRARERAERLMALASDVSKVETPAKENDSTAGHLMAEMNNDVLALLDQAGPTGLSTQQQGVRLAAALVAMREFAAQGRSKGLAIEKQETLFDPETYAKTVAHNKPAYWDKSILGSFFTEPHTFHVDDLVLVTSGDLTSCRGRVVEVRDELKRLAVRIDDPDGDEAVRYFEFDEVRKSI